MKPSLMKLANPYGMYKFVSHSLIMEFADNGDLFQKITEHLKNGTCFTEKEIWSIFIK